MHIGLSCGPRGNVLRKNVYGMGFIGQPSHNVPREYFNLAQVDISLNALQYCHKHVPGHYDVKRYHLKGL